MLLAACGGKKPAEGKDTAAVKVPVETAVAAPHTILASYAGTATLEAVAEADVAAKAAGTLLHINVEEGDRVHKGQVLARLDDADARAQLDQSLAQMRKADALYDYAKKAIDRKLIPQRDFSQAKYDRENMRAAYAAARLQLEHTQVIAPISGVISRRDVKLGNLVTQNQVLFHIVDMRPLQAVLKVPERELGKLKAGESVDLDVDALPGQHFRGKVARVAPVVDAKTGTFRVTAEFDSADRGLRPGMFGRLQVIYDRRHDALTVPRGALIEEDGHASVYVVERETPAAKPKARVKPKPGDAVAAEAKPQPPGLVAHRREVKVGYADGDRVEIRSGLKAGDRVITLGRNAVRDGSQVQLVNDVPAAASSAAEASP